MTLRQAVNAMCKACLYDPYEPGTFLAQIERCTSRACPLYEFRPKTIATRKAEASPENRAKGRRLQAFLQQTNG